MPKISSTKFLRRIAGRLAAPAAALAIFAMAAPSVAEQTSPGDSAPRVSNWMVFSVSVSAGSEMPACSEKKFGSMALHVDTAVLSVCNGAVWKPVRKPSAAPDDVADSTPPPTGGGGAKTPSSYAGSGAANDPWVAAAGNPRDCKAWRDGHPARARGANGVYRIDPDGRGGAAPFSVYCDQTTDGGGWTVFQRRQDGSVNFQRNWNAYKAGFGDPAKEHWLGNEKIHQLTKASRTLRVDMRDEGEARYAKYKTFSVAGEADKYRLTVAGYAGDAGDSLGYHSGNYFTTLDRDNDQYGGNCARLYPGGWWHIACHIVHLNGGYDVNRYGSGVQWTAWRGFHNSIDFAEMKLR